MSLALAAAAALATGYAAGRTRPLRRARHRAWAGVFLAEQTTRTRALVFLALHPIVLIKAATRPRPTERPAAPIAVPGPRWTATQSKESEADA